MSSKILIVEDAAETLSLLDAIFTEQGFGTLHAGNGRQALEIVQKEKPDLIISDILMPEMDGFVFFKELKKMEGVSHIPFFILTVRGRMEDTFRVLGVDEFFVKPFDSQLLLDKVKSRIRGGIVVDKAPTIKPQNTEAPPAQRVLVISDSAEIILKIGKVLTFKM